MVVWLLPQTEASAGCREEAWEVAHSSYELLASPLQDLAFTKENSSKKNLHELHIILYFL